MNDETSHLHHAAHEPAATDAIVLAMHRWIDQVVIGLDLCPFAARVRRNGALAIEVAGSSDVASVLHHLADIVSALLERSQASAIAAEATTLLVLPDGFDDFDDYLDVLALAETLLDESGLVGQVQLASFHPLYRFAEVPLDDPANYTNRSPYPALHVLQESAISRALEHHADPESIPQRNIQKLRQLDPQAALAVRSFCQPV